MELQDYIRLIESFVNNGISAEKFAKQYDETFLAETGEYLVKDRVLFDILEDLFEDVTAYDSMWKPEDENDFRITEKTLRKEAIDALGKLDKYIKGDNRK
jgi:hypothetical protein